MKYSTVTLASLSSVLLAELPVTNGAKETISVTEDDIEFKLQWYDDGRSKPYRAKFSGDTTSLYKFDRDGRVTNIKVGSEKYKVSYRSNGNLKKVILTSSRRRDLAEEEEDQDAFEAGDNEIVSVHRTLYECDECKETWDVMCDEAVPTVCELVGYGSPLSQAASTSIETYCNTFGQQACSASDGADICQAHCDSDDACRPNPCNGGGCSVDPGGGHICSCPSNSGGMNCQIDTSDLDTFYIELDFAGKWTDEQKESLQIQADRWEEVITHVPCGGTDEDPPGRLLIKAKQGNIDGVGGTLGFAYPDYAWNACPGITLSGVMKFDVADLAELTSLEIDLLYLHEMGHVIGIGTTWEDCNSCDNDRDAEWKCPSATAVYNDLAGEPADTPAYIIELNGGSGTRCAHFDEALFVDELMTGYGEVNVHEPLSKMSGAVLEDIEYIVDPSAMDAYTLPSRRDASDQPDIQTGDLESRRRPDVAFNVTRYLVGRDGSIVGEVQGIGMSF